MATPSDTAGDSPPAVADLNRFTALRVMGTQALSPHMRRVRFAGSHLEAFATEAHLHIGLLIPPPGASRTEWLTLESGGKARVRQVDCKPVNRKYTIRAIDSVAGRIDIDFVLHDDGGPGGSWAAAAQPGDMVGILGPGGRGLAPADWHLIAGDETALPAIGRMIEAMATDAHGQIVIEIADAAEQQALQPPPGVALQWLHRDGAAAGTTELLLNAIRAISLPPNDIRRFAWVGAEFTAAQAIRDYLCKQAGIARGDQLVVPYWRRGRAGATDGSSV
ncbi:siderophore-interacting protein [Croceibacterium xixiisoli]|nr:siderophore-interacting protein [Croceibacterium xixiisoli]